MKCFDHAGEAFLSAVFKYVTLIFALFISWTNLTEVYFILTLQLFIDLIKKEGFPGE